MRSKKVLGVNLVLISGAIDLAQRHGLTAYDAAYVAAARLNGWTLVSVDVADLVSRELAVLPEDA